MARIVSTLTFAALAAFAGDSQWGQFRGANGSGVDTASGYPVEFSPAKNVVWKTAVPYGQSSPVVADGRVYVTASEPGRLLTICLDAKTGKELWRRAIQRAQFTKTYKANDPASPTPVADANGVVAFFPDFGLAAYGTDGKDRWTLPLGPFKNVYGMGASPILAGDMLIMQCDQQQKSFLIAVDRKTGVQRWKTERAGAPEGVFQTLLVGSASVAGIVADPRVAAVTLTGSEGAGRSVNGP